MYKVVAVAHLHVIEDSTRVLGRGLCVLVSLPVYLNGFPAQPVCVCIHYNLELLDCGENPNRVPIWICIVSIRDSNKYRFFLSDHFPNHGNP